MQTPDEFQARIVKAQQAMKEFGLGAIVLEPGPAMMYLTGVRWGKSERSFVVVIPAKGEPAWVLPGFEEMRARELIHPGADIRVWQEDESPYERVAQMLKDRGVTTGRVGMDDARAIFRLRWRAQAGAETRLRQCDAGAEIRGRRSLATRGPRPRKQ